MQTVPTFSIGLHMFVRHVEPTTQFCNIGPDTGTGSSNRAMIDVSSGKYRLTILGNSVVTSVDVVFNRWMTLTLTFLLSTKTWVLYIDGVQVDTAAFTGGYFITNNPFSSFLIGVTKGPLDDFDVMHFEMHKRLLSAAEVAAQHQAMSA
jgi:hypothetical protein